MQKITYRRAQNSDSEVIKNILKETFEEYEINLPAGYSFSDIENLEEDNFLTLGGEIFSNEILLDQYLQCSILGEITFFEVDFKEIDFTRRFQSS